MSVAWATNRVLGVLPPLPPVMLALLVALWVAWMAWEIAGKQTLFASRARRRAAQILRAEGASEEMNLSLLAQDLRGRGLSLRKVGAALVQAGHLPRSGRAKWNASSIQVVLDARVA